MRESSTPPARETLELSEAALEKDDSGGLKGWHKAGLGVMTALTLTSAAVGAAGMAARVLPVCEAESGMVGWESGPCVSADISTQVDGVVRTVRGIPHTGQAVDDLASESNRVFQPREPQFAEPDGVLEVNSWNLHHGTSQNGDGARDQLQLQIDQINEHGADVDLLQEVLPWDVQTIVDGTGKVGYYTQTTPRQGNMILVSPEFAVTGNSRQTLNHETGTERQASEVVNLTKGDEPRAVQSLRLVGEDTNGQTVSVFNTHLSTGSATPEQRQAEHSTLQYMVNREKAEVDAVVGGGDLNTGDGREIVKDLRDDGYQVEGERIDWLVTSNVSSSEVSGGNLYEANGTRLSDHPMVIGKFTIASNS